MKKIKNIYKSIFLMLLIVACTEDNRNLSYLDTVAIPTDIAVAFNITQDNTGLVNLTPTATSATRFEVYYGDDTPVAEELTQGESVDHTYAEGSYDVRVVAYNINGETAEITQQLIVSFMAPQNLVVTIENDAAISKQVNVTATADYAAMYDFYTGESGNTDPISGNIDDTVSHIYAEAGTYTIRVVAKGAAIQTAEYIVDFEVTEILEPTISAAVPPNRPNTDVISLFSDAYSDVNVDTWNTSWSAANYEEVMIDGNPTKKYAALNFNGIETTTTPVDASAMTHLHLDVWTPNVTALRIKLVDFNGTGYNGGTDNLEAELSFTPTQLGWTSMDIPLTDFTGVPMSDLNQYIISADPSGDAIIFVDNFYFYKPFATSTFDDGLLTNGDFETGSDSWIVGVDDNSSVSVTTSSGNTHYSINVATAGNPWDVNLSQKVEIIQGNTYTLTFDAWSDVNRQIISGIGLSADPWTNFVETVDITTARTTYSLTLSAADFGALDARVIFDLGASAGSVNIDNVSLIIGNGNILTNGNFENGSDSWIIGVDDTAPAPVIVDAGNTHYFVNVATAGNPWDVNVSQKVEIIQGNTYTLTFDAWSDVNRQIISGIGLSADPWTNFVETVDITTARTTYSLTLSAADFGAIDARVVFDLGAAIGTVNIDNVSLSSN